MFLFIKRNELSSMHTHTHTHTCMYINSSVFLIR